MDWQPIETAPQDGTPVLVFYEGALHVARYIAVIHPENLRWAVSHAGRDNSRMVTEISANEEWGIPGPTHWHPLPAPPADAK